MVLQKVKQETRQQKSQKKVVFQRTLNKKIKESRDLEPQTKNSRKRLLLRCYCRARDVDKGEVSLPDQTILALCEGQPPTIPDSYIENYIGHYKQMGRVHSEQPLRLFFNMVCNNTDYIGHYK